MASISFQGVSKRFPDGTLALSNITLDAADGEFVVLVGPSGCGKSTLLRSAAGLEEITGGRIFLGGRDVTDVDPRDRDVAMVFQSYALYPHMTVRDNIAFALEQRKVPKPEIDRRVKEASAILHLQDLLHRKPGALSGGQRQRVAMGRAIVRSPAAYLMDEPLSNLDAKLRVQMRAELKLLNARLGVTTLYVTHDQAEAMTMGDRVAVLGPVTSASETNLQQVDTPASLYAEPANLFVASFIGSPAMNFLPATIASGPSGPVAVLPEAGLSLPLPPALLRRRPMLSDYVGRPVVLGLRPEIFGRSAPTDTTGAFKLKVNVLITEMMGADAYLHFDVPVPANAISRIRVENEDELAPVDQARIVARTDPRDLPPRGAEVDIWLDCERLHLFDRDTALAIR
jgi:multiple sugar transport system ATP-binding protein